jgi:hypothetical protein
MDPDPGGPKTCGSYGSGSPRLLKVRGFLGRQIWWIRNTGLYEELLEDDDPVDGAEVLANLVHNVHGDRIVGIEDRQQDDPIGRAAGRVLPTQLLLHLLRGQGLIRVDATPLGGRTVTGRHYRDF